MPIPTDTFWNIKRLNLLFAVVAVILMGITGATILQDFNKDWRVPQREGKVWEAALVQEKINRDLSDTEKQAQIAQLNADIKKLDSEITSGNAEYAKLVDTIKKQASEQSNMEFNLNTLKANVGVLESQLQDAMTDGDKEKAGSLLKTLESPKNRQKLAKDTEDLAAKKEDIAQAKAALAEVTAALSAKNKERNKKVGVVEALQKKLDSLRPGNLLAKLSDQIRNAPLMGFVNPSERVQQQVLPEVLTDVAFMKVPTIDRCTTCHVNIAKKEFTAEKVLSYLERQVSANQKYVYANDPAKPLAPSSLKPGSTAMVEFWHSWGQRLLSPATLAKTSGQLTSIAGAIGKTKEPVTDDKGVVVTSFTLNKEATTRPSIIALDALTRQNAILISAVRALYKEPLENKALATARNNALAYPDRLRTLLKQEISAELYKRLEDKYRYAMVDVVNAERHKAGDAPLDPSPVFLAHPDLSMYVDVDSKHPMEAVGCTSCHDGSGQETDFVLTAHFPKKIWVDNKTGQPILPQQLDASKAPKEEHKADLSSLLAVVYPEHDLIPTGLSDIHLNIGAQHDEKAEVAEGPAVVSDPQEALENTPAVPYVDPVTGKTGRAVSQFTHWRQTYEPKAPRDFELVYHEWDWPMRPPQYLQANCVRCHTDAYDIKEHAPVVYEGRYLFANLGCMNCHQMDSISPAEQRKVGPDLRHITSKLSPAFINTWIWAPKAFRPSTKMPHFFMLENSSSDEEIRRTRQEARAITEYLTQTATTLPPKHIISDGAKGSAEAGKDVFNAVGCLGCHANLNERGKDWITTDLVKGHGIKSDEAKAMYEKMTYNERQLYVTENIEAPPGSSFSPKYPDGSSKPLFMHHGPELSGVGTKLLSQRSPEEARAWLFDWLKEPRHYSEYTVMPRLRLSDQQALDLAEYLLAQKRTNNSPDDKWSAGLAEVDLLKVRELTSFFLRSKYSNDKAYQKAGDEKEMLSLATDALTTPVLDAKSAAEKAQAMPLEERQLVFLGKKLIAHYGCMSCHAINGTETITSPCANLSDWGQKQVTKLDFGYLDEHKVENELPPTTNIPMVNGMSVEAADLIHGKFEGSVSKDVDVAWPHVPHARTAWLTQKLKNTRVYDRGRVLLEPGTEKDSTGKLINPGKPYDKIKMPTFYLNDEQINAIVTFVISNRDRLISDKLAAKTLTPQARQIARGRALVEKYNCVSCHQIETNAPQVHQYYDPTELVDKAPPSLRGEGNKVQFDWMFNFFKNVEPLRPLLQPKGGIRMPSFPATDDEWTSIIAYFNATSVKESADLRKTLDPVLKYLSTAASTTTQPVKLAIPSSANGPTASPSAMPSIESIKDDWYLQPTLQSSANVLKNWALDHRQTTEVDVDPAKNTAPGALDKSYKTILFKALFTAGLYDAPYPFVDSPRPEISEERFKLGEQIFHDMQCLSCHRLGDESAAGAVKDPKGPNLTLVHERLQRRWSRHWVQEPPIIQVGTKMPQFFSGLSLFRLPGQSWSAAQGRPAEEVEATESKYGKTADEQNDLLLDFLYAAGNRRYSSIQPATSAQPVAPKAEAPKPKPPEAKPVETAPKAETPKVEEKPVPKPAPKPAAKPAEGAGAAAAGTGISGKVILKGNIPVMPAINMAGDKACAIQHAGPVDEETVVTGENDELANVFVYVTAGLPAGQTYDPPKTPAVIDQKGCMYNPHVLGMMVGQQLLVSNSDAFLHNAHSLAEQNAAFNFGQPNKDLGKEALVPKTAEIFRVKCDVHPWMIMYVGVFENPFFDVTTESGTFNLNNLPPGEYTVTAKHEKYGKIEQTVVVEEGKRATVNFTFKAE